ncbi:MAG: NADH-quinone oxidoreductase subunit C [Gallionella sp.]|jgi:Ni,Fe-hydrogenase III large subunit/Ni,Fe-hydrogenase III component G
MNSLNLAWIPLPGAIPARQATLEAAQLQPVCRKVADDGGRLLALWGSDEGAGSFALHVTLVNQDGLLCLHLLLAQESPVYPDISQIFPCACRMQRTVYDMLGVAAAGSADQRPWLRHAAWPVDSFPLRKDFDAAMSQEADDYPFVQVEGQGVHEIPVGPVHAGIIEPGHFRFSIIGERVLRLEERLGYVHKGIEKRFENNSLLFCAKLAGRVSGDSTTAYAWAYAMAAENMACVTPPERALWLRALFLERERIANHLGDLGYLANDVAFSFGMSQFWILKEQLLRNNAALFGHRYLMDKIIPGGVAVDLPDADTLLAECDLLEHEVRLLRSILEEHAGVQDRYIGAGTVEPKLASQLGLCGLAGRASSQAWDARVQFPCVPYQTLEVRMATHHNGDVAARVIVRFEELFESIRLQREILAGLPAGDLLEALTDLPGNGFALGMVEGWRGEVMVAMHTDAAGNISRVHPHDPSWQNWPLLEHAILGNIVPDFPLINKSFNLSYSGHDL